jgi:serine/threonine protein phosphatase PrpC
MNTKILLMIIISFALQASEKQKTLIAWGMSARTTNNNSDAQFYSKDTFSHALIDGHHFFGIFDGHGNHTNAINVCDMLKDKLHIYFEHAKGDVEERMEKAFNKIEKQTVPFYKKSASKLTGSTAVVTYITNKKIYLAHVGNSRALSFGSKGPWGYETQDHVFADYMISTYGKEDLDSRYQTKKCSINPMARVIGNAHAKDREKDQPYGDGIIQDHPEIISFSYFTGDDDLFNNLLVIATDGLWDVMTNDAVMQFVKEKMNKPLDELKQQYPHNRTTSFTTDYIEKFGDSGLRDEHCMLIARGLRDTAIVLGSNDNVLITVIDLSIICNLHRFVDSMQDVLFEMLYSKLTQ